MLNLPCTCSSKQTPKQNKSLNDSNGQRMEVYSVWSQSMSLIWTQEAPIWPPFCPQKQTEAEHSTFLLNFISPLSASTCYPSRRCRTDLLSSADRANLITDQTEMKGVERQGKGRVRQDWAGLGDSTPMRVDSS